MTHTSRPSLTFAAAGIAAKLSDRTGVRISYQPTLGLWCFRYEGKTARLPGEPTHFPTRRDAEAACARAGLKTDCYGRVWPAHMDLRTTR